MEEFKRMLEIELPPRQSAFLWGPRKTGKTTLLKSRFPESLSFDFLQTDLFLEFSRNPSLLRERLLAYDENLLSHPVILDEVQKVPQILDEVHWLIEHGIRSWRAKHLNISCSWKYRPTIHIPFKKRFLDLCQITSSYSLS